MTVANLHPSIAHVAMPERMARRPVDERGFPVPAFVAIVDGKPDHRVADPAHLQRCVEKGVCWLCGEPLGRFLACVIGSMCAINPNTAEPPTDKDCALYAVRTCPFLTRPYARRREAGLPADVVDPAGIPLAHNPGVALVWITRTVKPYRDSFTGGILFRVGDPAETLWFCEGRPATRAEVHASFDTGLPLLYEQARKQAGGLAALEALILKAMVFLPKE